MGGGGGQSLLALPRCGAIFHDKVEHYQTYNQIHIIHYSNLSNLKCTDIIIVNTTGICKLIRINSLSMFVKVHARIKDPSFSRVHCVFPKSTNSYSSIRQLFKSQ